MQNGWQGGIKKEAFFVQESSAMKQKCYNQQASKSPQNPWCPAEDTAEKCNERQITGDSYLIVSDWKFNELVFY